jgi:hypothetical protein
MTIIIATAASIFVTLSGPPEFCEERAPLSVCASITILVPISWLATTLRESLSHSQTPDWYADSHPLPSQFQVLGYFIAIVALCVAHLRTYPELWSMSIYDIAWFDDGDGKRSSAPQLPPLDTTPVDLSITPFPQPQASDDIESRLPVAADLPRERPLPSSPNVWWGRMFPGRAGRDHPFAIRRPGDRPREHYYPSQDPDYRSSTEPRRNNNNNNNDNRAENADGPMVMVTRVPVAAATIPAYLPQSKPEWQQQRQQQQRETRGEFGMSRDRRGSAPRRLSFVPEEVDEDQPIPVGDRSQWVRAPRNPGPYALPPMRPLRSSRRK